MDIDQIPNPDLFESESFSNNGGLFTLVLYSLTSLLILNFCLQILLAMPSLVACTFNTINDELSTDI